MSQGTTTHQEYDAAASSRRVGVTVVAAAVVAAVMVQTHGTCSGSGWNPGITGSLAMFSGAHWILVAMLLAAGVTLARTTSRNVAAVAAATGLVPATQLAGGGIVAFRHWVPAGGISGCAWRNLHLIQILALLGAIAGAVAALTCLRVLMATRRAPTAPSGISMVGRVSVLVGVLVAAALPLLLAVGDPDAHDLTSLGAFALLWSLPWGGALALTAWLARPPAIAAALAVAVSAIPAYPNYELVRVEHHWIAVLTGLVSGLVVASLRSRSSVPSELASELQ